MSHPFGDLLSQYLHRKHGLSQAKLAEGILQDPSLIGRMCRGERLTGPKARQRVTAMIRWLQQQGALRTLDEADALLNAAGMSSLSAQVADEALLIRHLAAHLQPQRQSLAVRATPLPRSDRLPRHNLPTQLTPFIGRATQISQLVAQVAMQRLLTLTGAGGVGKTRLALEVAACLLAGFADGVWFVDLASLTDPDLLPQRILDLWQVPEQAATSPLTALTTYLSTRHTLLILDNCEHLLSACAPLAETLLRDCPQLALLATSREALNIQGELPWRVPSLTHPPINAGWDPAAAPAHSALTPATLCEFEAVALFVERVRRQQSAFTLTTANVPAVAQLCRRLDGIPLALEMAAARVNVFTVEELAVRLDGAFDERFHLLTSGARTAPTRQQTLRATLAWSYALLTPAEQRLLAQLAVFNGGWTAVALQEITGAPLDLLAQLVNKSLVIADQQAGQTRYRLLETVRQFAAEQIVLATEEQSDVQWQHSRYYLRLLREQEAPLQSQQQQAALAIISRDFANINAAWQWAVGRQEFTLLAPAVHALFLYCEVRGSYRAGITLFTEATVVCTAAPPDQQVLQPLLAQLWGRLGACDVMANNGGDAIYALYQGLCYAATDQEKAFILANLGHAEIRCGNIGPGMEKVNESLLLSQQCGDLKGEARARHVRIWYFPDFTQALQHCEASLALWRKVGRPDRIAESLSQLAWQLCCRGDYRLASAYWEESMTVSTMLGMQFNLAWILDCQGWLAWCQGDLVTAQTYLQEAKALYHAMGMSAAVAMCQAELALVLRSAGEMAQAVKFAAEAVALTRNTGDQMLLVLSLNYLGAALIGAGDMAAARHALVEALQQGVLTEHNAFLLNTLYYFAELLHLESCTVDPMGAQTRQGRALTLLSCVCNHPSTWRIYRDKAVQLQAEIEGALPMELRATALARGEGYPLDELVSTLLDQVEAS